jgi:hypothetical protein
MASVALLTSDQLEPGAFGPQQWGIFNSDGSPVLAVDSVASIEYARDYQISDYPQEQGAFESYNKVQRPYQAKLGFLINESRFAFLNAVEGAVASLSLLAVITPEISYPNANLIHYGFRRESRNGVTLIRVEVWAEEVRPTGTALLSQSTSPTNASAAASAGSASAASAGGSAASAPTTSGDLSKAQSPNAASPQQGGVVQATPPQATAVINDGSPAAIAAASAAAAAPASPTTSSSGAGATMSYSFIGPISAPQ